MQMKDNLHLYLLELRLIHDSDEITEIDIDWKNEQRFLLVSLRRLIGVESPFVLDAEVFETYVENGFKL